MDNKDHGIALGQLWSFCVVRQKVMEVGNDKRQIKKQRLFFERLVKRKGVMYLGYQNSRHENKIQLYQTGIINDKE